MISSSNASRTRTMRRRAALGVAALVAALLPVVALTAPPAMATTPATFTATNSAVDGTGHCKNGGPGPDPVNCNIYDGKQFVWLNGGPSGAALADGSYFFAVLAPGGQHTPNDGGAKNLSDDVDPFTDRSFSVEDGTITNTGTHDFDNNKIRLADYANTTNSGGVYILAICSLPHPADPSQCKYDAFKVQTDNDAGTVNAVLSGTKWLDDASGDGLLGTTETGLQGWGINIYSGSSATPTATVSTDASGEWTWVEPAHAPSTGSSSYRICESLQTSWRQTGPTSSSTAASLGGATASIDGGALATGQRCWDITTPNDNVSTVSGIDFFNLPQGILTGGKYYDGNLDGLKATSGEAGIATWRIVIRNAAGAVVQTLVTDAGGAFTSAPLDPGVYTVREVLATNGWTQTGNTAYQGTSGGVTLADTVYTVTISGSTPTSISSLLFGNVCTVTPGGRTMGFWSNKNGQALIDGNDLAALVSLNLRRATGADFDPPTNRAYRDWLLAADASNMAYMLSAQLSATVLSVREGFTNGAVLVDGALSVNDVIAYANSLLANPPATTRAEMERVKNILDQINNQGAFVQPNASTCPPPVFPSS